MYSVSWTVFPNPGFRGVATGGLGHRGKFRGFVAVSFKRNPTGFRPQGHLRPAAHPKIALGGDIAPEVVSSGAQSVTEISKFM